MRSFLVIGLAAGLAAVLAVGYLGWTDWRFRSELMRRDTVALLSEPAWSSRLVDEGRKVFNSQCIACHGATGRGDSRIGATDLTDKDYLFGTGSVEDTEQVVLHGIRSGNPKGWNLASMPAYGTARPYDRYAVNSMTPTDINSLADYLHEASQLSQAGPPSMEASPALVEGAKLYTAKGCWDCHGADGRGDTAIGAPNLIDGTWLYGDGSKASIAHSIAYGRRGQMPAFQGKLSPVQARTVAAYVWTLSHKEALHGK